MHEMHVMKEKHMMTINKIDEKYKIIEDETSTYFKNIIEKIKSQMKDRETESLKLISNLTSEFQIHRKVSRETIESLETRIKSMIDEHHNILNNMEAERRLSDKTHNELIASLNKKMQDEIQLHSNEIEFIKNGHAESLAIKEAEYDANLKLLKEKHDIQIKNSKLNADENDKIKVLTTEKVMLESEVKHLKIQNEIIEKDKENININLLTRTKEMKVLQDDVLKNLDQIEKLKHKLILITKDHEEQKVMLDQFNSTNVFFYI